MPDREKVIKSAEICLKHIDESDCPQECPYFEQCCKYEKRVVFQPLIRDALAMLKEQEHKDRMYRALEDDWKRLKELLKEQEEQIRQLTEELEELRKKRNEVYYSGYDGSFIL
jgi:predicted ribosome quality control (RQC) complex YloA/Tae2 family protein